MIPAEIKTTSINNFDPTETISFDIKEKNISKIMGILTGDIYKNKPGAVIRELSTNCLDAHRLNGQTGKFTIILPSQYNNYELTIRDYGPGLSVEDMKQIYSSYGESTKDQTNDFTGCLGLGSKSPLSISNSFQVTTFHDNYAAAYEVYSENGFPKMNPLFQNFISKDEEEIDEIEDDTPPKQNYIYKDKYNEYSWMKNFLIGKINFDNQFIFGIKLKDYFSSLYVTTDGQNNDTINNQIEIMIRLFKEKKLDDKNSNFGVNLLFEEKISTDDSENSQKLELNERLKVTGILLNETDRQNMTITNITYDELNVYERSMHDNGFSFFSLDLKELSNIEENLGYFMDSKQLIYEDKELTLAQERSLKKAKEYQEILDDIYDTTFRTGLRIVIPVPTQYRTQILEEIKKQLLFFDITPKVVAITSTGPEIQKDFGFNYIKYAGVAKELAPDIFLIKAPNHRPSSWDKGQSEEYHNSISILDSINNRNNNCRLVQGGVHYPVELDLVLNTVKSASKDPRFKINMKDFEAVEIFSRNLSNTMVMFFNIGEIGFTPSREGLNYDAGTSIKIYDKLRTILDLYKKELKQFFDESMDELDFQQRYNSARSSAMNLSLFNMYNSNTAYLSALLKEHTQFQIGENLWDSKHSSTIANLYSLFKPISEINAMIKSKTEYSKPQIWSVDKRSSILKYIPEPVTRITNGVVPPIFMLVDGKKYRKVLGEYIKDIINHRYQQFYKNGKIELKDDNDKVIETIYTNTYKKSFTDKKVKSENMYTEFYGSIYIIFEDHLDLKDKPEDMEPEDYIESFLGLTRHHLDMPRVFNYKKELKILTDSGKIATPAVQKRNGFFGLGYSFEYKKMNPEGYLNPNKNKDGDIIGYSRYDTRSLSHYFSLITGRNADDYEFNIEDDEMDDFIMRVENNEIVVIPYDNKTKQLYNPYFNYLADDKNIMENIKNSAFRALIDEFTNNGGPYYYLWFLFKCGIINNDTQIVFAKQSVIQKMKLEPYILWEPNRFTNMLKKVSEELNNTQFFIHNYKMNQFHFGVGDSYSYLDQIFTNEILSWNTYVKQPIISNRFENFNLSQNLCSKISGVPVPAFLSDFKIRQEALKEVYYKQNRIDNPIIKLKDNSDFYLMVTQFDRLRINYLLIENAELISEKLIETDLEQSPPSIIRSIATDIISQYPVTNFKIYSIGNKALSEYKYLLLPELIAHHRQLAKKSGQLIDDPIIIKQYNNILKQFVNLNLQSLSNMDAIISDMFSVQVYSMGRKKIRAEFNQYNNKSMIYYSGSRSQLRDCSKSTTKKVIRHQIIFDPTYKKNIKRIENEIKIGVNNDLKILEKKLNDEKILAQYFINQRPFNFYSICNDLSKNKIEEGVEYAWNKSKPFIGKIG